MQDDDFAALLIIILLLLATALFGVPAKSEEPGHVQVVRRGIAEPSNTSPTEEESNTLPFINTNFQYTTKSIVGSNIELSDFPSMSCNADITDSILFSTSVYHSAGRSLHVPWGIGYMEAIHGSPLTDPDDENPRPYIILYESPSEYWLRQFIFVPSDFQLSEWCLICEPFTGRWFDITDPANAAYQRTICTMYLEGSYGDGSVTGELRVRAIVEQGVYDDDWTTLQSSGDRAIVARGEWHEMRAHVNVASSGRCEVWWKAESASSFTKLIDYSGDIRSTSPSGSLNDVDVMNHYKRVDEADASLYWDDIRVEEYNFFEESEPEPPIEPPPIQYYYVDVSTTLGGQVNPSGYHTVQYGSTFNATASPNVDFDFGYWTKNGVQVSTNPVYPLTGASAGTIYYLVAYFTAAPPVEPDPPTPPAANYFSVNIGTSTGGTTSLTGEQTLLFGETLTVTVASIDTNYRFNYWLLDNANWGTNQTFTLAGAANTSYTLLPVFQYVTPPPPDTTVYPAGDNMGTVSRGNLTRFFGATQTAVPPSIDIGDILNKLKKMRL